MNTFNRDGFALLKSVVKDDDLEALTQAIESLKGERAEAASAAGVRHLMKRSEAVREFAQSEAVMNVARQALGADAKPVKAILFDKTPSMNWYVTWHQDLTIAVKENRSARFCAMVS